ncbi:MAG: radical SAM protein [Deltaproteobacteria bacterium]|nr:radical SAM protein [Deltaproteobacteria bacterium]
MNPEHDARTLGITQGVCEVCLKLVPAKVQARGDEVWLLRFCPEHGEADGKIWAGVEDYLRTQRYVKPGWVPAAFEGDASKPCPEGCGFCERHEQHLCMPIVEITNRCDLRCPACINGSGGQDKPADMTVEQFGRVIDRVLDAEKQINVLNLSGGEPLMHPQLLPILDEAVSRKDVVRVSISTNGLRFLSEPRLLDEIRKRNVVVSLQWDGADDDVYRTLRGRALVEDKARVLGLLEHNDITTSLTMTLAGGRQDKELRGALDLLFGKPNIVSMMIQPLAFAGRGAGLRDGGERMTIPDVIRALGDAGHPNVSREDFVPLPCSSPLCFSLAFYLMLDEPRDGAASGTRGAASVSERAEPQRAVSINRLTDAATMMDAVANRLLFGLAADEHEKLKQLIYDLWSGPVGAVPEGPAVLATLRGILRSLQAPGCSCFDPRTAFNVAERKIKSIFIHAFQDASTFDLARVRRCCQAYPQADGKLIPACVRNVMHANRRWEGTRG